ncbi:N-acetylmuramoyl-L-alanine amidase [Solirhodobacter olei]|uniref:N-acetylmuramoyl-L-alanine amidase n=1 Tax=Solirhodobacter olei TaxID=2493082 RepID=UPI000FDC7FFB|nr:N-acetylmuramoyl-L-alanine amidase [Solirhodobacter olei]
MNRTCRHLFFRPAARGARLGRALALTLALIGPVLALWPTQARADQTLTALAVFQPKTSFIVDHAAGFGPTSKPTINLVLSLSRPVPYRVFTLANPPRLVLDFHEVKWSAFDAATFSRSRHVKAVRAGAIAQGWSRMVIALDGPYAVRQAEMATRNLDGGAMVQLQLAPTSHKAFLASAGAPSSGRWALPKPAPVGPPKRRQTGDRPLTVVLDPGHGGIDPGSINGVIYEKDITLSFARALREVLIRDGLHVVMTRDKDVFVPLETRLSIARAAGADLFLSIHADAEASREARGATVYTLAKKATDRASAELAARHDRDDIMAGVNLANTDDRIATVLMDLARTENQPRSDMFAADLVKSITAAGIRMRHRPHLEAAFSVLKSPDIPSALLELGYLSSSADLRNLQDLAWRGKMEKAIAVAMDHWARQDAAQATLLRH